MLDENVMTQIHKWQSGGAFIIWRGQQIYVREFGSGERWSRANLDRLGSRQAPGEFLGWRVTPFDRPRDQHFGRWRSGLGLGIGLRATGRQREGQRGQQETGAGMGGPRVRLFAA